MTFEFSLNLLFYETFTRIATLWQRIPLMQRDTPTKGIIKRLLYGEIYNFSETTVLLPEFRDSIM